MKRIIKAINKELRRTAWTEVHERFDGNHKEADRLAKKIQRLAKLKKEVEAI